MKKSILIICFILLFSQNAFSERISISSNTVNLRSGPGTDYRKLALIENAKNYPLDLIKKKGNWYQVKDYQSYTGWIYKSLISHKPTVITEIDDCSIRKGPGLNHAIIITANKNVCLKELSRQGRWIQVEYPGGGRGWIHNSIVW